MAIEEPKDLALFADLGKKDLEHIGSLCTKITLGAGQRLTREGRYGRQAVIFLSGAAEVERGGEIVATLGAGDIAGEIALLEGARGEQTATVTTTESCEVLLLTIEEFSKIVEDFPAVAARIEHTALGRLRRDLQGDD